MTDLPTNTAPPAFSQPGPRKTRQRPRIASQPSAVGRALEPKRSHTGIGCEMGCRLHHPIQASMLAYDTVTTTTVLLPHSELHASCWLVSRAPGAATSASHQSSLACVTWFDQQSRSRSLGSFGP